jgi:PAS domain S-box-containing protein
MDSNSRSDSTAARSDASVSLDVLPLHSTNLLTLLDEDGVILYESPSIEHIYGYDQDELVGEQVAEYFHPEDREAVVAAFQTVVAEGRGAAEQPGPAAPGATVEAVEYRHRQADGTYRWVESVASANPTPSGHYVVNTRDISDRKAREQRLERTNERLEEFASVVSHDLRNPLNVAQARLELARQADDEDHLAAVATAHDRMEGLIEDVLTLSRVGTTVTRMESVALGSLSDACWQTVATGDATLVTDTDRRLRADQGRLRQLLENLIRNAVEHGSTSSDGDTRQDVHEGEAESEAPEDADEAVTVTVGTLEDGFYVEDDGPGVPAAVREQAFEAGISTKDGGTGLGLRIVAQVVDAHGWEIRLTEGADGGARFEVTGIEFVE